jgi:hypothetical protein
MRSVVGPARSMIARAAITRPTIAGMTVRVRLLHHRIEFCQLIGSKNRANLVARLHADRISLRIDCLKLRFRIGPNRIKLLLLVSVQSKLLTKWRRRLMRTAMRTENPRSRQSVPNSTDKHAKNEHNEYE